MSAMLPPALLAHTVAAAFAPTGVLAQGPQALHPRAGQQAMAQAVAQAIDDAATLVVEAGTGVGKTFAEAYVKAQMGAGERLPKQGTVFLSVRDSDKAGVADVARELLALGFDLAATRGTAQAITQAGLAVKQVNKVAEGRQIGRAHV